MITREYSTTIPKVPAAGFVVLDTETNGGTGESRVIELGLAFVSNTGRIQKTFATVLRGDGSAGPWPVRRIHGIKDKYLADAPEFREISKPFEKSLNGRVVFAHNAKFDLRYLNRELSLVRMKKIRQMACTLELGVILGHGRLSLEAAVEKFELFRQFEHHAFCDAVATAQLLRIYMRQQPKLFKQYVAKFRQ
jgi:DNA polymerase III epsilon subunit family exonuclease